MPFEKGWTSEPYPFALDGALNDRFDEIPTYAETQDHKVGERLETFLSVMPLILDNNVQVDEREWAMSPEGDALVLAKVPGNVQRWLSRQYLRDPAYKSTELRIQLLATQSEAALLQTFWSQKRAHYATLPAIVLSTEISGVTWTDAPAVTTVPAGSYTGQLVVDDLTWDSQLAPFSILLPIDAGHVLVAPDDVEGVDDSHVTAAQQQGHASPVPAAAVVKAFATTKTIISAHLPSGNWLTDEHIHYPTAQQMGAVFVLRQMPTNDEDIEKARTGQPQRFDKGIRAAGVRLGDHIFISADQQGTGTEYHEAMHRISHPAVRAVLGWDFNEGVTEYFTRLLLKGAENVVRNDAQYSSQRAGVEFLLDNTSITEQDLANAYFGGVLGPLFVEVVDATKAVERVSLQAYANALGATSYDAQTYLERVLKNKR
jgi:hypothetical protein